MNKIEELEDLLELADTCEFVTEAVDHYSKWHDFSYTRDYFKKNWITNREKVIREMEVLAQRAAEEGSYALEAGKDLLQKCEEFKSKK